MKGPQDDHVSVVVTRLACSVLVASLSAMWTVGDEQASFAGVDFEDADLLFEAGLAAAPTGDGRCEFAVPDRLLAAVRLLPVSCLAFVLPADRYPLTEHTAAEFYTTQVEVDSVLDDLGVPVVMAGGAASHDGRGPEAGTRGAPPVTAQPVGVDAGPVRLRRTTGIALAAAAVEVAAVGAEAEEFLGARWPAVRQLLLQVRAAAPLTGGRDVEVWASASQSEVLRRLPLSYLAFVEPVDRGARSGLSAVDVHAAHVDVHRALPPARPEA